MKNASTVTLTVSRYVPFKDGRNFEGRGTGVWWGKELLPSPRRTIRDRSSVCCSRCDPSVVVVEFVQLASIGTPSTTLVITLLSYHLWLNLFPALSSAPNACSLMIIFTLKDHFNKTIVCIKKYSSLSYDD